LSRVSDHDDDVGAAPDLRKPLGTTHWRMNGQAVPAAQASNGFPYGRCRLDANFVNDGLDPVVRINPLRQSDVETRGRVYVA
jgi:hypothetical protein